MARPKISGQVVAQVRTLWAEDPKQSAARVHRRYHRLPGGGVVGLRRVQQVIAEAKDISRGRQFPLAEWGPWANAAETPEDTSQLLQLDLVCLKERGRHLYQHEAKWGQRLRVALVDLSPSHQLSVATIYAVRESVAFILDESAYTADLDGLVAYRPWLPENQQAYGHAVDLGIVPPMMTYLGELG